MYFRQSCNIELAKAYRLRGLHSLEIKKSVHQIVQTAKLQLPLSVMFRNTEQLEQIQLIDKIKEGDFVKIDIGYNDNNRTEFEGYIKRINTVQPLEIELEDELYLLRKINIKTSFKKADVKDILTLLLNELFKSSGLKLEVYKEMPSLTVTNFVIDNANGIAVLQDLQDKYGLASYLTTIDGVKTLYCGLVYGLKKAKQKENGKERGKIKYELQRNTINVSDLKYQVAGDKTYQIKVTNHDPSGAVREITLGDKSGEQRQLHFYGKHTDDELKQLAASEMEKFASTGYKGGFETFLLPNVEPGDVAEITEKQYGRNGNYYVGTVTTNFGSGARRKPEIDIQL